MSTFVISTLLSALAVFVFCVAFFTVVNWWERRQRQKAALDSGAREGEAMPE